MAKNPPQWNARKLEIKKLEAILREATTVLDTSDFRAEESARLLTSDIQNTCKGVSPPPSGSRRKLVYWWSPEIGCLRKSANHLRRVYQRKKKRFGPQSCAEEETSAKEAKLTLVKAIKAAKDEKWRRLCDQVEHDPWGMPYRLVMGRLAKPSPIPGINIPGRVESIVSELFPSHPKRPADVWPSSSTQEAENAAIQLEEIKTADRSLKSNTAPGPDGITNEVLKCYIRHKPDSLIKVYNKCVSEGHFPSQWKSARLVLLKKGDKPLDQPSSYRPLCILVCLGKLLEKILDTRLRNYLDQNNGLDERHFGFHKGKSTTDAVHTLRAISEANIIIMFVCNS